MLRCLHISNLAIVREVTLDLAPGLNLLTGETGAGKSILVDALGLLLGGRAGAELARDAAARMAVEAEFDLVDNPEAVRFLADRGYAGEGGAVVVRREIQPPGRGRSFLGGALAPVADLRQFGSLLVDVHGQHQQQGLLQPQTHLDLVDRHAGLEDERAAMAAAAGELDRAAARLASLRDGAQRVAQRIDMLRFQVEEIERAAIRPGERQALRAEREMLRHAETILRQSRAAYEALYEGEGAALPRLAEAERAARDLLRFDPSLAEALERAASARAELQEWAVVLRDYPSRLNFEPDRLEAVDERLALIEGLVRKYAPAGSEEEVQAHREAAAEELRLLGGGGESVADLEARVESLRAAALAIARRLSAARRAAAGRLEELVERELQALAMPRSRFAVDFRLRTCAGGGMWVDGEEVAVDATGYDVLEFLLTANQGEAMRPLAAVASGGELSRVMLALEVILRRDGPPRTLVFDEVDAGIGGAVAEAVGRRLAALARRHQVICVTHLPQIAACADHHVRVAKQPVRGRTELSVEVLDGEGQVRELARMLAGATITPAALRHAAELRARGAGRGREAGR
jgi:DNA repair protein RecN (Recombination protein N)